MSNRNFIREIAFSGNRYSKEKEYWLKKLSGQLLRSSFSYDFNPVVEGRGNEVERRWEQLEFQVNGGTFDKLIWAINNSDLRLFMILVTALMILLGKHNHQEDILVGAPIEKQETEGNFLNTILALRTQLIPGMTFKELLLNVRRTLMEARENQNFPLERMPYDLNMEVRENGAFALFDTAILLENLHDKSYIKHIPLHMIFSFLRTSESIEGVVEYNPALYREETVRRISGHFLHLLREAFVNLDTPIVNLEIIPESEKEFLLVKMNATRREYPDTTIHELFEIQAAKIPGNMAVEEADTGRTLTYRELNRRTNQLVNLLKEKGAAAGTAVAVMGERIADIVTAILAILKTGGIFLPLDAQNPDERLDFILKDSRAYIFISQQPIIGKRGGLLREFSPGNIIVMDDERIYKGDGENPRIDMRPADPAYVIYTSGTTGRPKGVMVEHKSLVNYIHFAATNYVIEESLNFPLYTSIAFDLTITSIFTPLVTGNAVVVYSGWNKGNLIERIVDDNKVGVVKLTPSHLYLIGEKEIADSPGKIRRFVVGGEILKYQIAREVFENFNGKVEIYNEYGPTEAAVGCMLYKFDPIKDRSKRNSVSIGVPAANAQIYLLDKNRKPVPIGGVGEIYIGGDCLARGYLNRPQLTSERFIRPSPFTLHPSPIYKTGDLARWLPDGNIEFLGRIDHQVKIRGFRIELGEIEGQLMNHPGIKDVVVTVNSAIRAGDHEEDKFLCAYFTSNEELTIPGLKEYLSVKLPDYMVPLFFAKLERIPLNSNGKVDRNALPAPEMKIEEDYIAPGNKMEEGLTEIWSDLLGVEKKIISINSNFFEMGGHSLNATILISKIHKEFNVKVSLTDVFRMPTVRLLAVHLNTAAEKKFTPIEVVEEKEYYELSSAQKRLYILQHLHSENIGYNIPVVLQLEGKPDKEKMRETFGGLIKRHENFRTTFELINDEPVQRIYDEVDFSIDYYETPVEAGVKKIVKDFIRPFLLDKVPLLRVGLIKMNEIHHILMLDMHHIISDGVSMNIFVSEYMVLYGGDNLPGLKLQYKDYSQWQNSKQEKESLKIQEEYWLKRFEGEIPVLNLPTDYVRPTEQSFEGSSVNFEIGIERTTGLKKLVLDAGVTLYIFMLAVYNILLSKISGQKDIIVGAPIAGRKHADLQQIIGVFVNILAFRNYVDEKETFLEFLEEVKRNSLDAFDNQEYQFEELVDKLAVKRHAGRNPLFDAAFMLDSDENQGGAIRETGIPGLKLKPYGQGSRVAKYDLFFYVFEGDNIHMKFEYCTRLFKQETINILKGYVVKIIDGILENPRTKLSEIDTSTQEKNSEVKYQFVDDLENE